MFTEAKHVAELLGIELSEPRICSGLVYRSTAKARSSTTEDYYRINFYYPTLDMVTADIEH